MNSVDNISLLLQALSLEILFKDYNNVDLMQELQKQDKEYLDKARQYINDNFADQLKFVDFDDYDSASVIKIIRKLSKEGCRLFFFATD